MKQRDLTTGPIASTLFVFALPILGGNVLQSLNGSINAMWVGSYLGEEALAGIANANNIMFFLLGAIFGFGMASTILVGQAMGRRDLPGARKVIGSAATFFFALSVVLAVVGLLVSRSVLEWMATPVAALPLADAYLKIIFLALPLLYAFAFLSAILRGAGDTRTPFVFLLVAVVLDIALVPILMLGLGPFPRLGMAGSALATLVANAIALPAMVWWLWSRKHPLWISRHERRLYVPDWDIVRAMVVKGVPMGLQMVLISLAMIAMISMVNQYGTHTSAAYGAALQLWTYVQLPAMAIGAAVSSMAAQNVGAGAWDRVASTTKVTPKNRNDHTAMWLRWRAMSSAALASGRNQDRVVRSSRISGAIRAPVSRKLKPMPCLLVEATRSHRPAPTFCAAIEEQAAPIAIAGICTYVHSCKAAP